MADLGRSNSQWIARVSILLREGFGVEDIAIKLKCTVEAVRMEVKILRECRLLENIYRRQK